MRVAKVDNNHGIGKQVLKSAGAGAAITGGMIATSQAYYWTVNRDLMQQAVKEYGGKVPYFKNFLVGTAYVVGLSAMLSGFVSFISEKLHSNKADIQ